MGSVVAVGGSEFAGRLLQNGLRGQGSASLNIPHLQPAYRSMNPASSSRKNRTVVIVLRMRKRYRQGKARCRISFYCYKKQFMGEIQSRKSNIFTALLCKTTNNTHLEGKIRAISFLLQIAFRPKEENLRREQILFLKSPIVIFLKIISLINDKASETTIYPVHFK